MITASAECGKASLGFHSKPFFSGWNCVPNTGYLGVEESVRGWRRVCVVIFVSLIGCCASQMCVKTTSPYNTDSTPYFLPSMAAINSLPCRSRLVPKML